MIKMGKFLIAALCGILLVSMAFVSPVTARESGAIEKLQGGDVHGSLIEFLREKSKCSGTLSDIGGILILIVYIIFFLLFPEEFSDAWNRIVDYFNPDGAQSLSL